MKGFGKIGFCALVTGVVTAMGCAGTRDPINRVQANAIPKSFFVGAKLNDASDDPSFYARSMVIDVPYGESGNPGALFTNGFNSSSKIKWAIEENNLVGRVSYERITGTDGKGAVDPPISSPQAVDRRKPLAQNDGVVVYNFKIESQFDIRRSYNPTTGEENNIVEENATDRPWYDREYIRVDFSTNLVTTAYDFDTLSLLSLFGSIKYTPMQFDIRNPNDTNAPVYDVQNGYIDVTNKVFVEPQTVDLGGGFVFPACYLPSFVTGGTAPAGNCNPNEITLRHAFKRVVDTDYEPTDWNGQRFETYGAFYSERQGYAQDYGLVDAQWKRFINRYNIWERSHVYADPEKMTGALECKVDADCTFASDIQGISHCDTHANKCALPYQARTAKPIVWHYSEGSAPDYYGATEEATDEWDTAMRMAVQVAKYAECQRFGNLPAEGVPCNQTFPGIVDGNFADEEDATYLVKEVNACRRAALADRKKDPVAECAGRADELGQARGYSGAAIAIAKQPAMVVLCHSPVAEADAPLCGKVGTVARLGDLRYHLVSAIPAPQTNSPWGIMTDANDPETGEHVAASINIWSDRTESFARSLVDTARYIGGELSTSDVTEGTYVDQWVEAQRLAGKGASLTPVLSADDIDKRVAAVAGVSVAALRKASAAAKTRRPSTGVGQLLPVETALLANLQRVQTAQASLTATSQWAPVYEARMGQLRGTPIEAALVTPAMQQLGKAAVGDLGGTTTTSPTSATAAASVLRGFAPRVGRDLQQKLHQAIAARGACVMDETEAIAPVGYAALSDQLQAKFGAFNARDSASAQNERADRMKDYLRRRLHLSVMTHEMGHSFGERHNFISSADPWNYRPQYWALRTNGKTVTAECPADGSAASDGSACIGPRWLDKISTNEHDQLIEMFASSSTMDYPGEPTQDLLGLGTYDFGAARFFYGNATSVYADARFASSRTPGTIAQGHQNEFGGLLGIRYGNFASPTHYSQLDKAVSLIEGCTTVDPQTFRPATWDDAKDGAWSPLLDGHIVTNAAGRSIRCTQPKVDYVQWDALRSTASKTHTTDTQNRVRVPHAFASDNWADLGNVAVFRNDNGADVYEQMAYWQAKQEMNHIFASYRRGRRDFSIWDAFRRSLSRYLEAMRDNAKAIALYTTLARDTVTQYFSGDTGDDPQAYVAEILKEVATDNTVASSIAFDHFTHVFSRPQPGPHGPLGTEDPGNGTTIARSYDSTGFAPTQGLPALFSIANGVSGGFGSISLGGRPIQNSLATDQGRDYNQEYTLNVGSYYEKAYTAYLLTESADNFISANRDDFVDPRFRSVSLADVFPDGFRRWLANNLTNDEQLKGNLVLGATGTTGTPALDANGFAQLAQTSWWPKEGIEACFPRGDRLFCHDPFTAATPTPAGGTSVDAQVGFEQQKFALIMTLIYLPENARTNWLDQLRVYDLSVDADPGFDNRIEFHSPDGKAYAAQTFGTEVLYGKTVQKGVGARVLEWANFLMSKGVVTDPVLRNGIEVGRKPRLVGGLPQYLNGTTPAASCAQSGWCTRMQDYVAVPKLMHEVETQLGVNRFGGWLRGVY